MKVHELLSDETKWTKKKLARNSEGDSCWYQDKNAVCWCLMGAIVKCYDEEYGFAAQSILENYLGRYVSTFNDDPNTTFEDVRKLCLKFDI